MTLAPNHASPAGGRIGPGRLVLVVGPSGAGKDTVMKLAAAACAEVAFPPRVITRPTSEFETNEEMPKEAFDTAVASGQFAFFWQAHGLSYGLRRSLDDDIRAGRTVVVNVSRTVIADLRARYADAVVVLITAPADVLKARLAGRGRASDGLLDERLNRASLDAGFSPDVTIQNVGAPAEAAARFVEILQGR